MYIVCTLYTNKENILPCITHTCKIVNIICILYCILCAVYLTMTATHEMGRDYMYSVYSAHI
jgi:hypothetical protein